MLQKNRKIEKPIHTHLASIIFYITLATLICQVSTLVTSTGFENQHGQVQKIKVATLKYLMLCSKLASFVSRF